MRKFNWIGMALIILTALVACPQNNEAKPQASSILTPENAWKGDIPADAEIISNDDFNKRIASGELQLFSTADLEKQKADRQKQYQDDIAFLQSTPNKPPQLQELLKKAAETPESGTDVPDKLSNGNTVILMGLGTQIRNQVISYELSTSPDNALGVYRLNYDILPADLKPKLPNPDSLQGKPISEINAARDQLEKLLALNPGAIKGARPEVVATSTGPSNQTGAQIRTQDAVQPGVGQDNDNSPSCNQPTGYFATFWFPLKYFLSPMKDQGKRGNCWAFTAVGAIESRERVQNDNPVDISEQFFVNKVKRQWRPNDLMESESSFTTLKDFVNNNQLLAYEPDWTYNRALQRPDPKKLAGVCMGYSPQGTCSESTHESREIFNADRTHKAYATVGYSGPGVSATKARIVWRQGDPFYLQTYRNLLANGNVLLAGLPIYQQFDAVGRDGFLNYDYDPQNYKKERYYLDSDNKRQEGSRGGHEVQIVGFLSDDEISAQRLERVTSPGGYGYFIAKNSWGCLRGDGGYYYIPAIYVWNFFDDLTILDFDARRSEAWKREQATPGGAIAPKITTTNSGADLRVEKNLNLNFQVSHPTAKNINFRVVSDKDGVLFNGPWSLEPSLLPPTIKKTFTTIGSRTISLEASFNGKITRDSFLLNVFNSAPSIDLQYPSDIRQGEDATFVAQIRDVNEANANSLCTNNIWSVDAPDVLVTKTGCQVKVKFGKTGERKVQVQTRDSDGLQSDNAIVFRAILPPATNPFPRLKTLGVSARDFFTVNGFKGCGGVTQAIGATIDLRQNGCQLLNVIGGNPPAPSRYYATIDVENPEAEALTYDWKFYITTGGFEEVFYDATGSKNTSFDLFQTGLGAKVVTEECRVTVNINAPNPGRSKINIPVWSGKCTLYRGRFG